MDYIDNLKEIKEQLFDAPVEVKQAFNQIVEYFANEPKKFAVGMVIDDGSKNLTYYGLGDGNSSNPPVDATSEQDAIKKTKDEFGRYAWVKKIVSIKACPTKAVQKTSSTGNKVTKYVPTDEKFVEKMYAERDKLNSNK